MPFRMRVCPFCFAPYLIRMACQCALIYKCSKTRLERDSAHNACVLVAISCTVPTFAFPFYHNARLRLKLLVYASWKSSVSLLRPLGPWEGALTPVVFLKIRIEKTVS